MHEMRCNQNGTGLLPDDFSKIDHFCPFFSLKKHLLPSSFSYSHSTQSWGSPTTIRTLTWQSNPLTDSNTTQLRLCVRVCMPVSFASSSSPASSYSARARIFHRLETSAPPGKRKNHNTENILLHLTGLSITYTRQLTGNGSPLHC